MPKPNYSPLRLKSISQSKSVLNQRYKSPYDLHLSLPPIKKQTNNSVKNNKPLKEVSK